MNDKPWLNFINQKQWEIYLKDLLRRNNKALVKSCLLIYESQTCQERYENKSSELNKVGFDKFDSYVLTKIAKRLYDGEYISGDDMYQLRKRMPKYWKQLMHISLKQEQEKQNQEFKQLEFDV